MRRGDAAMARMTPYKLFRVEAFKSYPALGRVVARDLERTVAIGIVQSVERMQVSERLNVFNAPLSCRTEYCYYVHLY